MSDLTQWVQAGREALAAPPLERVHRALTILPGLVAALDELCQTEAQLHRLRIELTREVRSFREQVWDAQKLHPEITYKNADIQNAMGRILALLDHLEDLLRPSVAPPGDGPSIT